MEVDGGPVDVEDVDDADVGGAGADVGNVPEIRHGGAALSKAQAARETALQSSAIAIHHMADLLAIRGYEVMTANPDVERDDRTAESFDVTGKGGCDRPVLLAIYRPDAPLHPYFGTGELRTFDGEFTPAVLKAATPKSGAASPAKATGVKDGEVCAVFLVSAHRVNAITLDNILLMCKEQGASRMIVLAREPVRWKDAVLFADRAMASSGITFETFSLSELRWNRLFHDRALRHVPLLPYSEEWSRVKSQNRFNPRQDNDIIVRCLGLVPGTIMRVEYVGLRQPFDESYILIEKADVGIRYLKAETRK